MAQDEIGKSPNHIRLGALNTFPRIRRALGRISKAVLAGELATKQASVLISALAQIKDTLREEIVESGLREIEARAGLRDANSASSLAFKELTGIRKRRQARERLQ